MGFIAPNERICNKFRVCEALEPVGIEPTWLGSRPPAHATKPAPRFVNRGRDWLPNQHGSLTQPDSGGIVKAKRTTRPEKTAPADSRLFERTVKRMLDTRPTPHEEMKKGAAPKRDPRSSGKGAKG